MRKIQVYLIADGRTFEDREEAEAAELALNLQNKITLWVDSVFIPLEFNDAQREQIATAIYEDREKIVKGLRPDQQ